LSNDDYVDNIRLQLPRGIGERYGTPPTDLTSAAQLSPDAKVKITTHIQMSSEILAITSPTHPDSILATSYTKSNGQPSRRRSTVRYRSNSYLDRDFVLIIRAEDLDKPRCFAELQEDPDRNRHCSLALQFTLVPKHSLPQISSQEYIFLLDRSGSMGAEQRLVQAKDTLKLLLPMLPYKGTLFNVVAFDDRIDIVFSKSQEYNEENKRAAVSCCSNQNDPLY
jgi:hypothetical protein